MRLAKTIPHVAAAAALALALLAAVSGCHDAVGSEGPEASLLAGWQIDLSGTWAFNEPESDAPPRSRADRAQKREGQSPSDRGPRGGRPGRRGPTGVPGSLSITQTDSTITFAFGQDRSRTFFTDGRVMAHQPRRGGQVEITARWSEDGLVVRHKRPRATFTRTYVLAPGGQQLLVTSSVAREGGSEPREFRHVFDRVGD